MKYYAVAEFEIIDQRWIPEYVKHVTKLVEQCGGRYLARTSKIEKLEGQRKVPQIFLIIEWPSKEAAESFYHSDEYRPYRESRMAGAKNELLLVAGEDIAKAAQIKKLKFGDAVEIRAIEPFLHYFGQVRERTMRVARCIPPDKIDWSYAPGKFTLGDLLRHIGITERYLWAETVQGRENRYKQHGKDLADGLQNILTLMERLHAESIDIFSKLSDEDLQRKCPTPGGQITTWKWLRLMTEHEIHHRGQVYLYLSMLGIVTPPLYGLTSEQVRSLAV